MGWSRNQRLLVQITALILPFLTAAKWMSSASAQDRTDGFAVLVGSLLLLAFVVFSFIASGTKTAPSASVRQEE